MAARSSTAAPARPGTRPAAPRPSAVAGAVAGLVAGLVLVLLLVVIVRLPWAGDLGMHAATLQRLRHDLLDPGDPLVDADTPSPYYSPWTVLLGAVARVSGLSVFVVLRLAAVVSLGLLVTGVWRYTRTLGGHRAAPAPALLSLLFLWGTARFLWSGFLGLHSLALTVSYPSTFTLGLAFHLWAWLTGALRRPDAGRWQWLGMGALWAVILLCHQFSGVVASVGAVATVLAARPSRAVWPRLCAGLLLGTAVLWAWPYYDFFALLGAGNDLEIVHRVLYEDLFARFGLALLGVAALAARWWRDRWDPLVAFFALGLLVVVAGWLTGHYSWGRALPAVLVPAQLAAALEVFEAGRRGLRAAWAVALAGALAVGAWTQAGAVGYVVPREALPAAVAAEYRQPWTGYYWITPWVRYGDVVMAEKHPARQIPAYGPYTVAPGYPDVFLPDERRRLAATREYFAKGTPGSVRRAVERRYGVRWVVDERGALPAAGLRPVARGPHGQVLYAVPGGPGEPGSRVP
ncbi:hypothetical protein ACFYOV_14355 [Streptomyces sp. NPDC005931]|uniref:hypothetical protein n=1 Tax=Streptomyces sp. NPDC005931 TaxID=3364737 RepID=UPI00368BFAD3